MGSPARYALLFAVLFAASRLDAQQPLGRGIEIGLDGGMEYSFDGNLLTIAVPFQRVRAAFPSEYRLAFEPTLAFTRVSSNGTSVAVLAIQVGALYDLEPAENRSYARPFAGLEYVDAGDADTVFDLGVGVGTRSRIADRLALRIEATITGRFGGAGGTDGAIGATAGLSFFTR